MSILKAQVMLVDGHALMRQSIAILVNQESDMEVCAEAKDGCEAIEVLMKNGNVDIVLLAVTFRTMSGFEIIKEIQSLYPALPVLFVSMNNEEIYAERALQAGAYGYVMKQESGEVLVNAIREVLKGNIFLSKKMYARLLNKIILKRTDADQLVNRLTPSEFRVLNLIGQGQSCQEIAKLLDRSVKTIETHRLNIRSKLNLKGSTELIRYATRWVNGQQ